MAENAPDNIQAVIEIYDENADGLKWAQISTDETLKIRGLESAVFA